MNDDNTDMEQNLSEEEKPATDINNENTSVSEVEQLKKQLAELNDKYLRLYSEFDNFRKRTIKEKSELIKTASEDVLKAVLPIIDDLERAIKANEAVTDASPIKEGILLIYNKLKSSVQLKGLTAFDCVGENFDADIMEAITHIPATDDSQKGKIIDEIEKGYKLGDKVIRYAKVVVAI
ncbi:MAG TPA: nucleotide exchange factor GrpE [Bacteroidia bacterium]|jgi:molecular chaperone GrpE|nr:nucleotide exchange factor GrpE [Bacteroidia bacterium]